MWGRIHKIAAKLCGKVINAGKLVQKNCNKIAGGPAMLRNIHINLMSLLRGFCD